MALSRTQLASPNCVVTDSDYAAIESAIMESSRGRWFLSEYARRNRQADTNLILSAINGIKDTLERIKRKTDPAPVQNIRFSSTYLSTRGESSAHLLQVAQSVPALRDQEKSDIDITGVVQMGQTAQSNVLRRPGQSSCEDLDTFLFI